MSVFAPTLSLYTYVGIAVGIVGCAIAAVVLIRHRDPFAREGGRLWMFHGAPDTGPHRSPGMREHDRQAIDPGTGVATAIRAQPVADASDDLAAEWEQAVPPMDS